MLNHIPASLYALANQTIWNPHRVEDKLTNIYFEAISRSQLEGDVVECGTHLGVTICFLSSILPHKKCIGYDTFTGLKGSTPKDGNSKDGQWACSYEDSKNFCSSYPVELVQCDVRHDFEPPPKITLAHIDLDIYEPTLAALEAIWPHVVHDGIVIIDDYEERPYPGIKKAINEFCTKYNPTIRVRKPQIFLEKQ